MRQTRNAHLEVPDQIPSLNRIEQRRQRRKRRRRKRIERFVRETLSETIRSQQKDVIKDAEEALETLKLLHKIDISAISHSMKKNEKITPAVPSIAPYLQGFRIQEKVDHHGHRSIPATHLKQPIFKDTAFGTRSPILVRSSSSPGHIKCLIPQSKGLFTTNPADLLDEFHASARNRLARQRQDKADRLKALVNKS